MLLCRMDKEWSKAHNGERLESLERGIDAATDVGMFLNGNTVKVGKRKIGYNTVRAGHYGPNLIILL